MSLTVIENASVFDGSGADPFTADVLIDGDRISSVAADMVAPEGGTLSTRTDGF